MSTKHALCALLALSLAACDAPTEGSDCETGETSEGTGESGEMDDEGPGFDADNPFVCDWPGDTVVIPTGPGLCTVCICGPGGSLVECDNDWFEC